MHQPKLVNAQWIPCARINTHAAKVLRRVLCILGLTIEMILFNIVVALIAFAVIFLRNKWPPKATNVPFLNQLIVIY